jgi:hypothetical protein
MRKAAVRDGDATTTGGFVSASSSKLIRDGRKKVALSGDEATCGNCEGSYRIFGTGTGLSEKGRDVVVDDDLVLCPCRKNKVIAGRDARIFLNTSRNSLGANSAPVATSGSATMDDYDRHFQLVDEYDEPIGGVLAHLQTPVGEIREVITTGQGKTPIIAGCNGESIKLLINYASK